MSDEEMLKKWLSNKENEAFLSGVKWACEQMLNKCDRQSMPILLSEGDDNFYISMEEVKKAINTVREEDIELR